MKGGMPWPLDLFAEQLARLKGQYIFVRFIGYETNKHISQHLGTNVQKGGMTLHPLFSYVKVRRQTVDVCSESRSSLNVHKVS